MKNELNDPVACPECDGANIDPECFGCEGRGMANYNPEWAEADILSWELSHPLLPLPTRSDMPLLDVAEFLTKKMRPEFSTESASYIMGGISIVLNNASGRYDIVIKRRSNV